MYVWARAGNNTLFLSERIDNDNDNIDLHECMYVCLFVCFIGNIVVCHCQKMPCFFYNIHTLFIFGSEKRNCNVKFIFLA